MIKSEDGRNETLEPLLAVRRRRLAGNYELSKSIIITIAIIVLVSGYDIPYYLSDL
jgi:hypothetical protein